MLGYFGPAGTFTHQALRTVTQEEALAFASVREALDAVRAGVIRGAVVPIENSVEGGVSATLDELIASSPLAIRGEIVIPVEFGLYARPGTRLEDVRQVLTHGHAAAQCREWLVTQLPAAAVTEAGSTAGAAAEVARPGSRYDAAVCARVAGQLYELDELAYQIEDNPGAVTRFVEVGPAGSVPERTGADKTTLVAFMRADHSGALLEILEQFAVRGVTVRRVLSDNGGAYRSHLWLDTCTELGITPKRTRPYRPQTNGKIERFHRTLADGWAYSKHYNSESARRAALPAWLHFYNHHRPHTAIGKLPPISRISNNLPGHYN